VSGGSTHELAIKTDGTLWSWGSNTKGQLGLGNTTDYSSPKQIGALTTWATIAAGGYFSIAVKTDGTLWSWGYNNIGQLGLNNLTSYSSPKQIGALTAWSKMSTGSNQTLAIKTDGTLWAWGYNAGFSFGVLGLGNLTNYSSPKQVGALTNWSAVSTALSNSVAVKTDGTLWTWGRNNYGSLGLGNTTNYSSPKQVGALTAWSTVTTTETGATLSIKTDGTLWSWGSGQFSGQLGLGNTTNYSSPKQVGALTNWSTLSAQSGRFFVLARKTNGTLWSWGSNAFGQLGLGNTTDYSSPKQIGALTTWSALAAGRYSSLATYT
jgi:alpha-tubulin suppressor-like RCC1 family protein